MIYPIRTQYVKIPSKEGVFLHSKVSNLSEVLGEARFAQETYNYTATKEIADSTTKFAKLIAFESSSFVV